MTTSPEREVVVADDTEPAPTISVPFNVPHVVGTEAGLIGEAIAGRHLSGDGPFTRRATTLLQGITTSEKALLTTSCTHALELSALLLDLQPGDEVILPSFTFVSTANAFVLRGATPVFVDIRADTRNIDERRIAEAITPRTRAIVVVHYGGVGCEMDEIMALAAAADVPVIEDAAHAFGATYRGRALGSIGALATLSFHETKNVQCGEGGALLINDPRYAERAEILREKGTNRSQFLRGQVDKYSWVDVGSSYLPAEVLAAFLTAQLEAFDTIQARRMQIWRRYDAALADWAAANGAELAAQPADRAHPAHLFAIVHPDIGVRQRFMTHMKAGGIATTFHYVPLHTSIAASRLIDPVELPVTDAVAAGLVRLPLYPDLTDDDVARVIERTLTFAA